MEYQFRFEPHGTRATQSLPKNEIWLDIGGRSSDGVYDHHDGNCKARSSMQLVYNECASILNYVGNLPQPLTIVLHSKPDLDAIGTFWLVKKIMDTSGEIKNDKDLIKIINIISDNDQGYYDLKQPEKSWSVIFRTLYEVEHSNFDDLQKVEWGVNYLDETLRKLKEGRSFEEIAEFLTTQKARQFLLQARRDYINDLTRAKVFQVMLPVHNLECETNEIENSPQKTPDHGSHTWGLADAILLQDPKSSLFKELARSDTEHSLAKHGFALLVVSHSVAYDTKQFYRHIISTDSHTGFHLKGLGDMLEQAEQKKEENNSLPLLEGRERLKDNSGRFGYNVPQPWYDGRGHFYTIIDSPSMLKSKPGLIASNLTTDEVLETVWDYGNPGKHIILQESVITLIISGSLGDEWRSQITQPCSITDRLTELSDELKLVLNSYPAFYSDCDTAAVDGYSLIRQEVWEIEKDNSLWIGTFKLQSGKSSLHEIILSLNTLIEAKDAVWLPQFVKVATDTNRWHIIHNRFKPNSYFIDDESGYSAVLNYKLATASGDAFNTQPDVSEVAALSRVISRDHRYLAVISGKGMVVQSIRDTSFQLESDFHKVYGVTVLSAFALAQKKALQDLSKRFANMRLNSSKFMNTSREIIEFRWELIKIEQEMIYNRVAEKRFGQNSYESIIKAIHLQSTWDQVKGKVEVMEKEVSDTRANFYQRIVFIITTVLAPLGIVSGLMSGSQLHKDFANNNVTLLPSELQPSGWLHFLVFLLISTGFIMLVWIISKAKVEKSNILRRTSKSRRSVEKRGSGIS